MTADAAPRVFAVIPAAGVSSRMGTLKQLLPFRGSTMLETVIAGVLAGGVDGLVVVTNSAVDQALRLSADDRYQTVIVDRPEAEMLESILLGVDRACAAFGAGGAGGVNADGVMVCPGDIPAVGRALVAACADAFRANPDAIVVGAYGDRVGHPIVVPVSLRAELDSLRGRGLKEILTTHADRVRRVQAQSEGSMADIDTPEDYRASDVG